MSSAENDRQYADPERRAETVAAAERHVAEDGLCPWCRKPGSFAFPPYWMHDVDADAHRCPRGNHWTLTDG